MLWSTFSGPPNIGGAIGPRKEIARSITKFGPPIKAPNSYVAHFVDCLNYEPANLLKSAHQNLSVLINFTDTDGFDIRN